MEENISQRARRYITRRLATKLRMGLVSKETTQKEISLYVAQLRQVGGNLLQLTVGGAICAAAINGIVIPHGFAAGGITGLAVIIRELLPRVDVGLAYLLLNVPLFIGAIMAVGRRFFFYSLAGAVLFSLALLLIKVRIPVGDHILAAILAGIMIGAGAGITLRSLGSAGGADILSVMLMKRFSIPLGSTILALNALVLSFTSIFFSPDAALFTLIQIFVAAKLVNLVVTGLSQRKAVLIISPKCVEINREILRDLRRGTTIITAEGGYTGKAEKVLYAVVNFRELGPLKRMVRSIDPDAFVVVSDTLEVMNYRIGNQPHW